MGDSVSPQDETRRGGLQIINRVGSLPMVQSTWNQLGSIYGYTKQSNGFVKFGLETAESALKIGSNIAAPVIVRLEKPVSKLDDFAVSQLDKLEDKVPIITKDANGLYEATLKPSVDKISAATQYGRDTYNNVREVSVAKVNGVKQYTYDTVEGARDRVQGITTSVSQTVETSKAKVQAVADYSKQTVDGIKQYSEEKVTQALDTTYGQAVVKRVGIAVITADKYVDYYLPEEEGQEQQQNDEASYPADDSVLGLGWKVSSRLYKRSIDTIYKYTPVDLTPVEGVVTRVKAMPSTLQSSYDNLKTTYTETSARVASVPQSIRSSFTRSKEMMNSAYKSLTLANMTKTVRTTAWNTTKATTTYVRSYTYSLYTMVWEKLPISGQKAISSEEPPSIEMEHLDEVSPKSENVEEPNEENEEES